METKIQKTNRYGQFTILEQNRSVNEAHVKNLVSSLSEVNLLAFNPIIVNSDMEVIDGQHRLEAAKRLKLDIYYVVAKTGSIKETRLLNKANKSWFLIDYVKSYAIGGNKTYMDFLKFIMDYDIPVSTGLELVCGDFSREVGMRLRKGVINIKDMKEATEVVEKMYLLQPFCKSGIRTRVMIRAIRHLKDIGADFDKLVEKLKVSDIKLLPEANYRQLLRQFEDAINYKVKINTTRLY